MTEIAFAAPDFANLKAALYHAALESAAILIGVPVRRSSGEWRILVRDCYAATDADYVTRTPIRAHLTTSFCLPIETRARADNLSLIYVHTHPAQKDPKFSPVDDATETSHARYLIKRNGAQPHFALVIGSDGARCRGLGSNDYARVVEIGNDLRVISDPAEPVPLEERFDRQVRAFGKEGQARLSRMTIGVVGLGGTGSQVVQQLAYLGVKNFILIDDDHVEETNLNRIVGATPADCPATPDGVGTLKIEVAERQIRALHPDATVRLVPESVLKAGIAQNLVDADFVFSCTDTQGSRHLVNAFAYQYRVPVIDMGVGISVSGAAEARFNGHTKMLAPGLPCLWCAGQLNSVQVRRDFMTDAQRAADPYFNQIVGVVQPAVISLNGTMVSVAVTMFLSAVVGVPSPPRFVTYDGSRARMNALATNTDADCNFCGPESTLGWGSVYPLPERRDG